MIQDTYGRSLWNKFCKHRLGLFALYIVLLFCLIGVYAPFLASSKPFFVMYEGELYFPLFRYLFYQGYYSKYLDIFFNLLMFTLPFFWLALKLRAKFLLLLIGILQALLFCYLAYRSPSDPASDVDLNQQRHQQVEKNKLHLPSWAFDLKFMNAYAKLNLLMHYKEIKTQDEKLRIYLKAKGGWPPTLPLPTLWGMQRVHQENERLNEERDLKRLHAEGLKNSTHDQEVKARLVYQREKEAWLNKNSRALKYMVMPLVSSFHWEEDAGGSQELNQHIGILDLTRTNRKDLTAALIFGVRISLVVGITAVGLALLIGIPIGAFAGFYGGKLDIVVSRLLEIWEAMPTFFMLLMAVAFLQNKSIFVVISIIGLFGWTGFSRYIRGEFFKQRNLPYVEACRALGFSDRYTMFSHILPNAIQPLLTLLPFAVMSAITSEAGLSFLGLGEEGSCSWGVLMDEGRNAFPAESYLLWPPAIALTLLLIAVAMVGDAFRDALDPKQLLNK